MTDLAKLKKLVDDDEFVHTNQLDEMIVDRYAVDFVSRKEPIPQPLTCVYCNAPWTPEMIEVLELSGHCTSCYDSQRIINVFCSACTRLVYRKEV